MSALVEPAAAVRPPEAIEDTTTFHEFLDGRLTVRIPDGYEVHESTGGSLLLARRGDWASALAEALPDRSFSDLFLEDWFHDDVVAYVKVQVLVLTDPADAIAAPRELHDRFAGGFTGRWGEHSFCFFADDTGIGRCANYAGAFIFAATRKVGDVLLITEALDNVEALVLEQGALPDSPDTVAVETLWSRFRAAADDRTVTEILNSARLAGE